jgi:hypothetical protein
MQPTLIRTLSEQHWNDAEWTMMKDGLVVCNAGTQGQWRFEVRRDGDNIIRVTYYNGEIILVTPVSNLK